MTSGERGACVLELLMAMRNPRIAFAMTKYGFSEAELEEGWTLLLAAGRAKLDTRAPGADASTIRKLEEYEDFWFSVAAPTLARRFPAVHAQLFKDLSETDGPDVAVSVRTLIERFDRMAAGAYGAEGLQAKAILETRGLTQSDLNGARALLETAGNVANVDAVMAAQDPKRFEKAENDLWEWYLEWSELARAAVTHKGLLRQLGLLSTGTSRAADMDDLDTDVDPITGEPTSLDPFDPCDPFV